MIRAQVTPAPLADFPPDERAEIERLASAPTKPPRWLDLGLVQLPSRAWFEWHARRGINPGRRRDKLPRQLRRAVLERDGLRCQLCAEPVDPGDVHLDHVVPVSLGGPTTAANLQVTHSQCNLRKGNRS